MCDCNIEELQKENKELKQKIAEMNLVIVKYGIENQEYRMRLEDMSKRSANDKKESS